MDTLTELLQLFEEKLADVRVMIASFEEGMDFASHCTLQGFAEGLAYAIDEIRTRTER